MAETTVYFRTPRNAYSFFVEDFQSDTLYWFIWDEKNILCDYIQIKLIGNIFLWGLDKVSQRYIYMKYTYRNMFVHGECLNWSSIDITFTIYAAYLTSSYIYAYIFVCLYIYICSWRLRLKWFLGSNSNSVRRRSLLSCPVRRTNYPLRIPNASNGWEPF